MLSEYEVERAPTIEASLASSAGLGKTKRRVCGSQQLSVESLNASLVSINLDGTEVRILLVIDHLFSYSVILSLIDFVCFFLLKTIMTQLRLAEIRGCF